MHMRILCERWTRDADVADNRILQIESPFAGSMRRRLRPGASVMASLE
jgi:hypothetical protein